MKINLFMADRGEGKTTELVKWAKENGAIVICRTQKEASILKGKYNVLTISVSCSEKLIGWYKPIGIDNLMNFLKPNEVLSLAKRYSDGNVFCTTSEQFKIVKMSIFKKVKRVIARWFRR